MLKSVYTKFRKDDPREKILMLADGGFHAVFHGSLLP